MQLINNKNTKTLAGNLKNLGKVDEIFNFLTIDFLDTLSKKILKDKSAKKYSDLISLAFWIRKKNIILIKKKYDEKYLRVGLGTVFHITPANVALNFAYSFVMSVLSGNSNIIRVSSVEFAQKKIFFRILNKVLNIKKFKSIKDTNKFISYEHSSSDDITKYFSSICDCRIIWGSDKTVNLIKKYDTKATCKEIIFSDKYSISIVNFNYLKKLKKKKIKELSQRFYLDSLLFDQKACTSPHLILWYGKQDKNSYECFWSNLNSSIKNGKIFETNEKNMIDRYSKFCEFAVKRKEINTAFKDNYVFRTKLKSIPKDIYNFRVGYGYYFEYFLRDFDKIKRFISPKIQTLTYAGFNPSQIKKMITNLKINGIDRAVPFGRALEYSEVWDGYDLPRVFSKIVDIKK